MSPILRSSRASSVSSAAAPKTPSFSASASAVGIGGASVAAPIVGHEGSTALTSTSAASPLPVRAIARIVAMVESLPKRPRNAASSGVRRRWISENDASPPRMTRPCRAQPVVERLRQALDPDDRGHAERDADEKDPEARESAAQIAQREAQDRRAGLRSAAERRARSCRDERRVLDRAGAHPDRPGRSERRAPGHG